MSLKSVDLAGIAEFITSGRCRSVAFLTGAGVSVACGIPDFRSPGGMYDSLRPEILTATESQRQMMRRDPTSVVSTAIFFQNQLPYLELRRPFILGTAENQWKATMFHFLPQIFHEKGMLRRVFSQNIDGLHYQADLPPPLICSVHGSLASFSCEFCKTPSPPPLFISQVKSNIKDLYKIDPTAPPESSPIPCLNCGKNGVKPDTVLYGGAISDRFFRYREEDLKDLDLLIVGGTSLQVSPANSVVSSVPPSCVRLVINNEIVGTDLGIESNPQQSKRDFFLLGDIETKVLDFVEELGWMGEMERFLEKMNEKSREMFLERKRRMEAS